MSIALLLAAAVTGRVLDLSPGITITGKRNPMFPPPAAGAPPPVRYYPERAQIKGLAGEAIVRCKVSDPDASIGACTLVKEEPTGEQFGERAVLLATKIKISGGQLSTLRDKTGSYQGAEVIIPIHFVLDPETPAPAAPTPAPAAPGH